MRERSVGWRGFFETINLEAKKIALLEAQLIEERSAVEARLAQEKASTDQKEKSLTTYSTQLEEEVQRLFRELVETKVELSKARGDLSTSKTMRSQLESEIQAGKDYDKKIVDAHESVELVARSHINKYLKSDEFKGKVFE